MTSAVSDARWTCPVCGFAGLVEPPVDRDRLADLQHLPLLRHAVRRRRSRQAARRAAQGVGAGGRASGGRRTSRRPRAGTPTRSCRRQDSPMAVRATDSTSDEPRGLGLVDSAAAQAARAGGADHPARRRAARRRVEAARRAARGGHLTCTSDDALFVALDEGTKAAPVEVVYARSFYAGSSYPSGPLSGEAIGVYAARDPDEVRAALDACVRTLEREAWFYAADEKQAARVLPARGARDRQLSVARGGHRRRCADGVPDRAAARVDGRRSTRR